MREPRYTIGGCWGTVPTSLSLFVKIHIQNLLIPTGRGENVLVSILYFQFSPDVFSLSLVGVSPPLYLRTYKNT